MTGRITSVHASPLLTAFTHVGSVGEGNRKRDLPKNRFLARASKPDAKRLAVASYTKRAAQNGEAHTLTLRWVRTYSGYPHGSVARGHTSHSHLRRVCLHCLGRDFVSSRYVGQPEGPTMSGVLHLPEADVDVRMLPLSAFGVRPSTIGTRPRST